MNDTLRYIKLLSLRIREVFYTNPRVSEVCLWILHCHNTLICLFILLDNIIAAAVCILKILFEDKVMSILCYEAKLDFRMCY